jgi:hypothetical protein
VGRVRMASIFGFQGMQPVAALLLGSTSQLPDL